MNKTQFSTMRQPARMNTRKQTFRLVSNMLSMTQQELEDVVQDVNMPRFLRTVARQLLMGDNLVVLQTLSYEPAINKRNKEEVM